MNTPVHEHPRDAKQSIVSGFKIKIAPVHSDFDVAFFPLSLMGFAGVFQGSCPMNFFYTLILV